MCKHVAAVLYGVGSRLDSDPGLFFVLRKIDINELITETVKQHSDRLLGTATAKGKRIMADENVALLFGIDLTVPEPAAKKTTKQANKKTAKKGSAGKTRSTAKRTTKAGIKKTKAAQKAVKKSKKQAAGKSGKKSAQEV